MRRRARTRLGKVVTVAHTAGAVAGALFCLVLRGTAGAQTSSRQMAIVVQPPVALSPRRPPFGLVESYLAVNPRNPANLIASAMSTSSDASVIYVSTDTGRSWAAARSAAGSVFRGGDPMLVFAPSGRAYFVTIAPALAVWRSVDGGTSWHGPAFLGDSTRYDDRGWVAVAGLGDQEIVFGAAKSRDPASASPRDALIFASSRNGGGSFGPVTYARASGFLQAPTHLMARANGTLLLAELTNFARTSDGRYRGRITVRSLASDGVVSDAHPVADYVSFGVAHGNRRWMGLGVTLMTEDRSSTNRAGTLYMVWSAPLGAGASAGDVLQIQLSRSVDGGRTWASPIRVNQAGFASNHSSPAVAVNKDGSLAVSWMDRRDDPDQLCYRPYIAISTDGGASFVERRVSSERVCPGDGSRWMNGGETHGLAPLADGSYRMIWTGGPAGELHLWSTVISVRPD